MVELPKINSAAQHCLDTPRGGMVDETLGADDGTSVSEATLTDLAQRAREVRDGAERIRSIAKAMGTFSRLESTQGSRINLNLAIESAVTMARTTIRVRSNLVVDLGALPPVWASEGKLSQVFLNLLINAAQAIEEGNADQNRIEVRTWADADHVFATVTDTGTGIARESLGRIFDPFFTTKSRGEGSGLGLCICRNIVTDFGGDISVESEPGEGTRFVIRLPIQKSEQVARCDEPVSTRPASASARGRILVVDDEPAIRAMLVQVLGVEHEVLIAESGEEACAILEDDQSFDVILCDLMMLEMTGMDLHSWLAREHPKLAARVVFITGGAFTARALDYVHRVGNPLLHKPFDTVELARVLAEVIGPTSEAMGMSALRAQARSVAPFSSG
jgi:CheY-like chemotaxis protein/anti-sigma regulatory factor (Ser/Thr protein kinase)